MTVTTLSIPHTIVNLCMQKFPIQMRREENYDNNELREAEIGCPEDYRLVDQTAVKASCYNTRCNRHFNIVMSPYTICIV
jgi:hypothetical protein